MRQDGPITAWGATTVPLPTSASGPMTAKASTTAPGSTRASGWTWAAAETPVSPVSGPGRTEAGKSSRPTVEKSRCGWRETITATPAGAVPARSSEQTTTDALTPAISPALRRPSTKTSAPARPESAGVRKATSLRASSGVASVAPVNAAISPALNRRDGVKKTGSLMQAFSSGPPCRGPEARARLLEAGRDAEIEVLDAVGGFLLDRDRVVDAKRTEGRRPDDAGADGTAPF